MFLQTSDDIVRQHPELEPAVRFVDGVLEETSHSAILDPRQFARVSGIDENQVESVLELYAEANQVVQFDAFECEICHVLTQRPAKLADAEDIRCSKCDSPADKSRLFTAYRYTATASTSMRTDSGINSTRSSQSIDLQGFPMSAKLTQQERNFVRDLFAEGALPGPDLTAIDTFINDIDIDSLAQALKQNLKRADLNTAYYSMIDIAHAQHALGDLLFELSKHLGSNRNDIAVAGALFAEKYQKANSASTRDSFFSVERSSLEKLTSIKPFLRIKELGDFLDQAERRICKVKCQGEDQGTGFLIGEDLVLTCFHVIEHADSGKPHLVSDIEVEFDFLDHGTRPATTYALNSDWGIPFSKYSNQDLAEPPGDAEPDALDYAVLKLAKAAGKDVIDGLERSHFDIGTQKMPPIGTPILIAGHPGPDELQPLSFSMAAPGYAGLTPNKTRIIYKTSTEHGSSGSPVFDHNFRVIGIHHNRGEISAANETYYDNNRGIPISLIAQALGAKKKE